MGKIFGIITILVLVLSNNIVFAQTNDDIPYLSDDDIYAIELILPDDTPARSQESSKKAEKEKTEKGTAAKEANEMPRLNSSWPVYHLLILDRLYSPLNSDIINDNLLIAYKYRHGSNGYLIAIYKSPKNGPVFARMPDNSRIIVDLITSRKNTIKEYINSDAFRKFVKNRTIIAQLLRICDTKINDYIDKEYALSREKRGNSPAQINKSLQVGAFYSRQKAESFRRKLEAVTNKPVVIVESDEMYKVRINGFDNASDMSRVRRILDNENIHSFDVSE